MTNRLSDLDRPELTLTRRYIHICKYELISLFLAVNLDQIFPCFHIQTNTSIHSKIYEHYYLFICYLSSCDKVKLFVFLTFLFLSIFFCLHLFVLIVLYIVGLAHWFTLKRNIISPHTYQLYGDTINRLMGVPKAIDDRDGWEERG